MAKDEGWILITHPSHGCLAGEFAKHWKNRDFPEHQPAVEVNYGVSHHDDAWASRDHQPFLTREGLPSAFSKELVGTYDSFEEIDMEDYLEVRGRAAEVVAEQHPYAAVLISMHTHNLLTEHVDLSTLTDEQTVLLKAFNEKQTARREEWIAALKEDSELSPYTTVEYRERAFQFLQGCDSLSLIACVAFDEPIALQHKHPTVSGGSVEISCTPLGAHKYRLNPYPMDEDELQFELPYKYVASDSFDSLETFRAAYSAAELESLTITLVR